MNGTEQVSEINVGNNSKFQNLLNGELFKIFGKLDEKALNGLLVNIHTPLKYTMEPNLQYSTIYELLDLKLKDNKLDETITVSITLKDIVNLEDLVRGILGDGLISGLIGALTDKLIQPILDVLRGTLEFANIKLPNLGINNIQLNGTWDAIHVSNGTIAPPLAPTQTN